MEEDDDDLRRRLVILCEERVARDAGIQSLKARLGEA